MPGGPISFYFWICLKMHAIKEILKIQGERNYSGGEHRVEVRKLQCGQGSSVSSIRVVFVFVIK